MDNKFKKIVYPQPMTNSHVKGAIINHNVP